MSTRRVFVICSHPLFHQSLQALLKHPEIEWVGVAPVSSSLPDRLVELHPDIIILEGDEMENVQTALKILGSAHKTVRVIGLSMSNNGMHIFETEQGKVNQTEDLLRIILKE